MADLPYNPAGKYDQPDETVAAPPTSSSSPVGKYDQPDPPPPGGTQDESWLRYPRMALQSIAQGVGSDIGSAGDVLRKYVAPYADKIRPFFPGLALLAGSTPTHEEVNQALNYTGIQAPDITPQNLGERVGSAALRGAGAAGPFVAFAPEALPVLASGAVAGAGEQTAREVLPPSAAKWAAPFIGLTAGSLVGSTPEVTEDIGSLLSDLQGGNVRSLAGRYFSEEIGGQLGHLASAAFGQHMETVGRLAGLFFPTGGHLIKNLFTHIPEEAGGLAGSEANSP